VCVILFVAKLDNSLESRGQFDVGHWAQQG